MINSIRKYWKSGVVVLALGSVAWTMRHSGADFRSLPRPSVAWLIAATAMFLVQYLIQAIGWHLLLRSLGQAAPPRVTMRMWYMSLIARWMPGRVWYTASRLVLARQNGLSVTAVTFAVVMELVYILVGGVIVTLSFAGAMFHGLLADPHGRLGLALTTAAVFVCAALVINPANLLRLYDVKFLRKTIRKVAGEDLDSGGMPVLTTSSSLLLLVYFTGYWLYSGLMFGVLAHAFVPMSAARWLACIPAFPCSWLIGFFSIITPAGLGAREGSMWLMLHGTFGGAQAGVLAISSRLMMMAVELISVGIASVVLRPGTPRVVPMAEPANGALRSEPDAKALSTV